MVLKLEIHSIVLKQTFLPLSKLMNGILTFFFLIDSFPGAGFIFFEQQVSLLGNKRHKSVIKVSIPAREETNFRSNNMTKQTSPV